jgi:hypothetical protein
MVTLELLSRPINSGCRSKMSTSLSFPWVAHSNEKPRQSTTRSSVIADGANCEEQSVEPDEVAAILRHYVQFDLEREFVAERIQSYVHPPVTERERP